MKPFKFILMLAAMAVAVGFSSCADDEDEPAKPTPTVTLKGGATYTSTNVTKNVGETIKFGIVASGVEDLTEYKVAIRRQGSSQDLILDQMTLPNKTTTLDKDWTYDLSTPGIETVLITVTMENGESTTVSFVVTINTAPRDVQTRQNIMLGGQSNTVLGSFFNFSTQSAMKIADARADQANADIMYYEGSTNKNTFCSTDDPQATQIFAEIATWTKKPNRFRKTTLTAAQFDAIPDNSSQIIDDEAKKTGTTTMANQLKVGDVVFFQIFQGNYGLAKITNIVTTSTGTITFDLKFPKE